MKIVRTWGKVGVAGSAGGSDGRGGTQGGDGNPAVGGVGFGESVRPEAAQNIAVTLDHAAQQALVAPKVTAHPVDEKVDVGDQGFEERARRFLDEGQE